MYVCMYVCMYVYMVHMYVYMMYVCIHGTYVCYACLIDMHTSISIDLHSFINRGPAGD